jgi:hypothetical protein
VGIVKKMKNFKSERGEELELLMGTARPCCSRIEVREDDGWGLGLGRGGGSGGLDLGFGMGGEMVGGRGGVWKLFPLTTI